MFLKFRVKACIAKFIVTCGCNSDTLQFFEAGPIDRFMHVVELRKFDANQGAIFMITGTVSDASMLGILEKIRVSRPSLYRDLDALWHYCADLVKENEEHWGPAFSLGDLKPALGLGDLKVDPFDLSAGANSSDEKAEIPAPVPATSYATFDDWLHHFKVAAARSNQHLAIKDGRSLIDYMELTPLRRAFNDGVGPHELGREFAEQFDFSGFMKTLRTMKTL